MEVTKWVIREARGLVLADGTILIQISHYFCLMGHIAKGANAGR